MSKLSARSYNSNGNNYRSGYASTRRDQEIHRIVEDNYTGLSSTIDVTSSEIQAKVNSSYEGLSASIRLTKSEIEQKVQSDYEGLNASIRLTKSEIEQKVQSDYEGLSASIRLTKSEILLRVSDDYKGLTSYIETTASNITLSSDKIYLSGTTKLNDVMTVTSDGVYLHGEVWIPDNTLHPKNVSIAQGGSLSMTVGTAPPVTRTLNGSNWGKIVTSVSTGNNTLTLTQLDGTVTNFSKATSLGGVWDGELKYTVTATQTNKDSSGKNVATNVASIYTTLLNDGVTWNGYYGTLRVKATIDGVTAAKYDVGSFTYIDASDVYASGGTLTGPTWDMNGVTYGGQYSGATVKPTSRTVKVTSNYDTTGKTVSLYLTQGSWSSNKKMVYMRKDSASGSQMAGVEVDATQVYNAGNANRGSKLQALWSTDETSRTELKSGTKYNVVTQYENVDGTYSNGQTYYIETPSGYDQGWADAVKKVSRVGNTVYVPSSTVGKRDSYELTYYESTFSYTESSYTKESHTYNASSHSHTSASLQFLSSAGSGVGTYTSEHEKTAIPSAAKTFTFRPGSDSYNASSFSISASSYTKEKVEYNESFISWKKNTDV